LYLNLLFKSIKSDVNFSRIQAFVKRIIQVASSEHNIGFAVGLLLVISEIAKSQPGLWSMVNQPEENDDNMYPYDGFGRTPEYSNASKTCLWELLPLLQHFHPTIQHYARVLLSSQSIILPNGDTDPLELYTLARFLDKFVYKNPKKVPKKG
ncbi:CBF/Mak21 family-domain-containing protein, partial [Paraphysoderma sedebokerense]